jgi:hypothetical protein
MSTTPNGSGPELEKFPDAPPSIEVTAPEEVPHAGLRSLDHCTYFQSLLRTWPESYRDTSPNRGTTLPKSDCSFNISMYLVKSPGPVAFPAYKSYYMSILS